MTTRVLVTGCGGAAGVSFIKAIQGLDARTSGHGVVGAHSDDIEIFAADMDPCAPGLYLVPAQKRVQLPPGKADDFVDVVLATCATFQIDILVPTVDVELLPVAAAAGRFARAGVRVMTSPLTGLERCLDKWSFHQAMESAGLPVPRCKVLDDSFALKGPPLLGEHIAKPRQGSGARGILQVKTREALSNTPRDGSYLLQDMLPGAEYSVDVLTDAQGDVIAAVPRERMRIDSGIATVSRTVKDRELMKLAAQVTVELGLRYCVNVQFRRDEEGRPKLLEVNPRFPGTMPLTVAAGVNMPKLALDACLGRLHATGELMDFEEIAVVRYLEEVVVKASAFDQVLEARVLLDAENEALEA